MGCLNYNCATLTEHEVSTLACKGPRPAGISSAVFILCSSTLVDPSDGTEINALITSGDAKLVENIRMGLGSGEVTQSPKVTACGLPQTLYVTYSGNITDYSFNQQNMEFWTTLTSGYTISGIIARLCPKSGFDDESLWMDGEVSFSGSPVIADTDEEAANFAITYQYKGTVSLIPTPTGVFSA
jgi:hypothetical protein